MVRCVKIYKIPRNKKKIKQLLNPKCFALSIWVQNPMRIVLNLFFFVVVFIMQKKKNVISIKT